MKVQIETNQDGTKDLVLWSASTIDDKVLDRLVAECDVSSAGRLDTDAWSYVKIRLANASDKTPKDA